MFWQGCKLLLLIYPAVFSGIILIGVLNPCFIYRCHSPGEFVSFNFISIFSRVWLCVDDGFFPVCLAFVYLHLICGQFYQSFRFAELQLCPSDFLSPAVCFSPLCLIVNI